jgi:hypothetical protein
MDHPLSNRYLPQLNHNPVHGLLLELVHMHPNAGIYAIVAFNLTKERLATATPVVHFVATATSLHPIVAVDGYAPSHDPDACGDLPGRQPTLRYVVRDPVCKHLWRLSALRVTTRRCHDHLAGPASLGTLPHWYAQHPQRLLLPQTLLEFTDYIRRQVACHRACRVAPNQVLTSQITVVNEVLQPPDEPDN